MSEQRIFDEPVLKTYYHNQQVAKKGNKVPFIFSNGRKVYSVDMLYV
jgi:hypothetical protein